MNTYDVIRDAVAIAYERRKCVYCGTNGLHAGGYPIVINARGDTFGHLGCHHDELKFIEADRAPDWAHE